MRPGPFDGDTDFVQKSAKWRRSQHEMTYLRTLPLEDGMLDGVPMKLRGRCVLVADQDAAAREHIAAKYGVTEGFIRLG